MSLLNAFSGVSTVFLMGLLGFLLAAKGGLGKETMAALPKFITSFAIPPYLLRTATTTLDREQLVHLADSVPLPFLSIILVYALGLLLAAALKVPRSRRGLFPVAFATSNAMNIGLPINIALFGEAALPYALLYFCANALFFWTIGCYTIARSGEGGAYSLLARGRQLLSPPLLGFFAGLALVYFDAHLPAVLDKTCKYIGDTAIALGTIYVGAMVQKVEWKEFVLERDLLVVLAGRFFVSPLMVFLLTLAWPVPSVMRQVFVIQSSLPVMINVVVLAAYYKTDTRFAATATGISTVLSMCTIPLYMLLMHLVAM